MVRSRNAASRTMWPALWPHPSGGRRRLLLRTRVRYRSFLKLRVPLGVDQAVDPLGRGHRETHRHGFARRRGQAMLGRLAMQVGAVGVGDDQAGILWKYLARQILREGKEQPVAMHPVVLPFLVG